MDDFLNNFDFIDATENTDKGFDEKKDDADKILFSCKQCNFETYNKRGISIHITSMHKNGKASSTKSSVEEISEDSIEFTNEGVVKSTQAIDDNPSAEEIAKMYESNLNLNEEEANAIPDNDTIDMVMKNIENEGDNKEDEKKDDKDEDNPTDDLFTENVLLNAKLKSVEEIVSVKDRKLVEYEEQIETMQTDFTNLTKTVEELEQKNTLKNEEATILLAEKNSLDELRMNAEEKSLRFMKTVEKLYKENNTLKKELQQKKTTIELLNNGTPPTDDTVKNLKDKLVEKTKKLDEANNDKKQLAKELAKAEDKLKAGPSSENENGRVEKLTNLLKVKKQETKTNQEEIKKIKLNLTDLQEKLNTSTNKNATLEAQNTRLEKQCDSLLEALEKEETIEIVSEKKSMKPKPENENAKCRKHDKGRCFFGPKCSFSHTSNNVCKTYSKLGFCEEEERCLDRHPTGVCLQWRRAICDKGVKCFYQHPDKEYGSISKEGSSKDAQEVKRKRSNSGSFSPSVKAPRTESERSITSAADPFLYERMAKLEKEVEMYRRNNQQQHLNQPQQMFMMAPNVAQAQPTPQSWSAVAACPGQGGSNITTAGGSWGNMMPQELRMPGMTQFYQPSQ